MGKKAQARLLHEIRTALLERGFHPTRTEKVEHLPDLPPQGLRLPGFKLEKHSDSKSVRLSYRIDALELPLDRIGRQLFGETQMRRLVRYNAALEEAGFVCLDINSRDPLSPYSVWQRARKA